MLSNLQLSFNFFIYLLKLIFWHLSSRPTHPESFFIAFRRFGDDVKVDVVDYLHCCCLAKLLLGLMIRREVETYLVRNATIILQNGHERRQESERNNSYLEDIVVFSPNSACDPFRDGHCICEIFIWKLVHFHLVI